MRLNTFQLEPPTTAAFPDGLPLTKVRVPNHNELLRRLDDILMSGTLTNGPTVRALEEALTERLNVPFVLGVSSCTAGLMLVLRGLEITGPVAVPSFTFSASAHAIDWVGGIPVFIDIDNSTLTACVDDALKVADSSSAIMVTHVYGTPADVDGLQQAAEDAGVPLIFDAAHALGSTRRGVSIGGFGTAEVFSLSPTKIVTGAEGGIVATTDEALADVVRVGRNYGNPGNYDTEFVGLNARMSELHAAVALASLSTLDERLAARNRSVELFRVAIAGIPGLRIPQVGDGDTSTYKDLTVVVDEEQFGLNAGELLVGLKSHGVDSRRYFYPPVHQQKAYAHLLPGRPLPVTERISPQVLTLPLWAGMEDELILRLADLLGQIHTANNAHR
jgi:dTDP-4-amino-4,6-dideoxygalactose transaminase